MSSPPALHPGEILYLQLHWRVHAAVGEDWTVFTHLLRRDEATAATSCRSPAATACRAAAACRPRAGSQGGRCWTNIRFSCRVTWCPARTRWLPVYIATTVRVCLQMGLGFSWEM